MKAQGFELRAVGNPFMESEILRAIIISIEAT